jgi:flavin-dependent dehydrogenase
VKLVEALARAAERRGARVRAGVRVTGCTSVNSVAVPGLAYKNSDSSSAPGQRHITVGLRVTEDHEEAGLDFSQHGEVGYRP